MLQECSKNDKENSYKIPTLSFQDIGIMHLLRIRRSLWAGLGSKIRKKGYFQDFHFSSTSSKSVKLCTWKFYLSDHLETEKWKFKYAVWVFLGKNGNSFGLKKSKNGNFYGFWKFTGTNLFLIKMDTLFKYYSIVIFI